MVAGTTGHPVAEEPLSSTSILRTAPAAPATFIHLAALTPPAVTIPSCPVLGGPPTLSSTIPFYLPDVMIGTVIPTPGSISREAITTITPG